MSSPSQWPLSPESIRFIAPPFLLRNLARHPLTHECYPTAMGYYPHAQGHRMRRSRPDDNLLLYCVDGRGSLSVEDEHLEVNPGDVVVLRQGTDHEYAASIEQPWSLYWVHFQGSHTADFVHYLGAEPKQPWLFIGASPTLIGQFNDLLAARHTGYSAPAFIHAANQLRQLFTRIALDAQTPKSEPKNLDIAKVQQYMRDNLHHALALDNIARVAGLSKYHFSNRYRAMTGLPPIRHFTQMRMEAACRLLDSDSQSITQVAAALGYEDSLYFSRVFRRIVGVSPRGYRQSVTA